MRNDNPEPRAGRADEHLKSLNKISRILDCFSSRKGALSLTDVCSQTGYPKSTTHRLIASMKDIGLLDQDQERDRYRLGLRLFELGNIVLANMELHREARPFVDALSRISGQLVHLAVFDGQQAIVIHRADPSSDGAMPLTLVENAPVYCTSVGKAVLAFQPDNVVERVVAGGMRRFTQNTITDPKRLRQELASIRRQGYAVDDAEHQPGLRCVGAPIRDQTGRVFAGISVSGPSWKVPASEVENLSQIVIHHAAGISGKLGYRTDAAAD